MSDIDAIKARIAAIMADLQAHPEEAREVEERCDRHTAFIRGAETAMWANRRSVPEQPATIRPITGANKPRRKPVSDD